MDLSAAPQFQVSKIQKVMFELENVHKRMADRLPDLLDTIVNTAVSLETHGAYQPAAEIVESAVTETMRCQHDLQDHATAMNHLAGEVGEMADGELVTDGYDWESQITRCVELAAHVSATRKSSELKEKLVDLRQQVWDVHHVGEPVPDGNDGAGDGVVDPEDSGDDDLQVFGGVVSSMCPILQSLMLSAVRNTECGHVYSREGAEQLLQQSHGRAQCPQVGCGAGLDASSLKRHRPTEDRARREQRSQQRGEDRVLDFTS